VTQNNANTIEGGTFSLMQYIYKLADGKDLHTRVFASRSRRNNRRQNNDQRFNLDIFGDEGDEFGTAVVVLVDNACKQGA
jgi:hypothetical protein